MYDYYNYLRGVVCGQVLDMEPLPKVKHAAGSWKFPRKRRRSNTDPDPDTPNGTTLTACYSRARREGGGSSKISLGVWGIRRRIYFSLKKALIWSLSVVFQNLI